jgi:hypothetical protein
VVYPVEALDLDAMDAAYFAHQFRALLTDLTFNSKVLIDELTRMSQDVQHSRFVAQCIDEHITNVSRLGIE